MDDFSVSVLVPTFERFESTIAAVQSALAQTRPPEQILVIDDGSSEVTQGMLAAALDGLPVDLILANHTGHPGRVRNIGFQRVQTSHVAFLDSDDLWVPEKLEVQESFVRKGARAQASGYFLGVSEANQPEGDPVLNRNPTSSKLTLKSLLRVNSICNSSVLVETSLIREVGGLPISYGIRGVEDYAAWLRIAFFVDWVMSDQPLVQYGDYGPNSMRATNHFSIPENDLALLDFVDWLERNSQHQPRVISCLRRLGLVSLRWWAGSLSPSHDRMTAKALDRCS